MSPVSCHLWKRRIAVLGAIFKAFLVAHYDCPDCLLSHNETVLTVRELFRSRHHGVWAAEDCIDGSTYMLYVLVLYKYE